VIFLYINTQSRRSNAREAELVADGKDEGQNNASARPTDSRFGVGTFDPQIG
jgi:hypothetical protein